jgi:hypothetical protein
MAIFGKAILAMDNPPQPELPESADQREKLVSNDIRQRLQTVCKDLPEEEFQDLVARMTREQLRSERLS